MNGFEMTQRVKAMAGAPTVILLTYFEPKGYRYNTTAVGADGFIAKDNFAAQLMPLVNGLFDRNCATESSRPGSRQPNERHPPISIPGWWNAIRVENGTHNI
jgi:DNA-binding NarL/FixJ family response regulator